VIYKPGCGAEKHRSYGTSANPVIEYGLWRLTESLSRKKNNTLACGGKSSGLNGEATTDGGAVRYTGLQRAHLGSDDRTCSSALRSARAGIGAG